MHVSLVTTYTFMQEDKSCKTVVCSSFEARSAIYGNAHGFGVAVCVPQFVNAQCDRLQSVLNAAARSIAGLRRSDHISDALASFHWLRAPQRIQFKTAVLTFRALHGLAPAYLSSDLRRTVDTPSRRQLPLAGLTFALLG